MKNKRYLLKIYLPKSLFEIPFYHIEDLYSFLFSLNCINKEIIYMVWDIKNNHLLDVITRKEN